MAGGKGRGLAPALGFIPRANTPHDHRAGAYRHESMRSVLDRAWPLVPRWPHVTQDHILQRARGLVDSPRSHADPTTRSQQREGQRMGTWPHVQPI
jgi:hypothetical protein